MTPVRERLSRTRVARVATDGCARPFSICDRMLAEMPTRRLRSRSLTLAALRAARNRAHASASTLCPSPSRQASRIRGAQDGHYCCLVLLNGKAVRNDLAVEFAEHCDQARGMRPRLRAA